MEDNFFFIKPCKETKKKYKKYYGYTCKIQAEFTNDCIVEVTIKDNPHCFLIDKCQLIKCTKKEYSLGLFSFYAYESM
jgi:uncharacterized protein YbaA (DUF1428 family)